MVDGNRHLGVDGDELPIDAVVEAQRAGCEAAGSPLYAAVLEAVAGDLAVDGPSRRVFAPCAGASYGDAVALRMLAGLHHLVLAGRAPALARHYPSAGGTPGAGLAAAVVEAIAEHEAELVAAMDRPVQTNEVGRSVALLCGLEPAGRGGPPLRVLEIGASAGLNLSFDRYRYEADGLAIGPPDAPLRFSDPFLGRPPGWVEMPEVAERAGCDLDPIDPTSPSGVRRLRSLVWPDQVDRRARLDAAIATVAAEPYAATVVERADAVDWVKERLDEPRSGLHTVVVHSIVLQYVPLDRRRRFVELVEQAGERASADAPVSWLRMEPAGDRAETRLTTWPGGHTVLAASSGYHGPPVAAHLSGG